MNRLGGSVRTRFHESGYSSRWLGPPTGYTPAAFLAGNWLRYRQWKQEKGIAEGTLPEDDTDGDGIGILEEYAFGLDPAAASNTGRPSVGTEGTDLTLTYQLERTRTDLTVGVEESTDLITWIPATVSSTGTVLDSGSIRTFQAKVPLNAAEKKFLRLKITALTN